MFECEIFLYIIEIDILHILWYSLVTRFLRLTYICGFKSYYYPTIIIKKVSNNIMRNFIYFFFYVIGTSIVKEIENFCSGKMSKMLERLWLFDQILHITSFQSLHSNTSVTKYTSLMWSIQGYFLNCDRR